MPKGEYDRSTKKQPVGIHTIPPFTELLKTCLKDEESAIDWCEENGIIPPIAEAKCPHCNSGCRVKNPKLGTKQLK